MTPYYDHAGITIYHGDCRDVLPGLAADSCGLVLTDPPYAIGKAPWDTDFPTWWMDDAARIAPVLGLMPGVWNLLRCPETVGRLRYRGTLAAHLSNGMTNGPLGYGNWIPCVVYSAVDAPAWCAAFADWCDSQGVTRADLDRIAGTSNMGDWWISRLAHRSQIPCPAQWERLAATLQPPARLGTLVYANPFVKNGDSKVFVVGATPKPDHPTPKPYVVMSWLVGRLPGKTVLDPFMGSGTTLRAAKDLGRKAIGIEIEERYCEIAAERLRQEVLL